MPKRLEVEACLVKANATPLDEQQQLPRKHSLNTGERGKYTGTKHVERGDTQITDRTTDSGQRVCSPLEEQQQLPQPSG